jgi:hypothetical protein
VLATETTTSVSRIAAATAAGGSTPLCDRGAIVVITGSAPSASA